jgi:glycosyltransferase involved in cell wall biosynthesis
VISTYQPLAIVLSVKALNNQTCKPFQIIISENSSGERLKEFSAKNNCDYIYTKTPSRSIARNAGFSLVKGDVTLFLDEDIIPTNRCLEYYKEWFKNKANSKTILNGTVNDFILTTETNNLPKEAFENILNLENKNTFFKAKYWRVPSNCFGGLTKIFAGEKSLFDENFKGYGEEDIELNYRLYKKGIRFFYSTGALVFHKRHKVDYKKNILAAKKNIFYFLKKHNYASEIILTSQKVWRDCYGLNIFTENQARVSA